MVYGVNWCLGCMYHSVFLWPTQTTLLNALSQGTHRELAKHGHAQSAFWTSARSFASGSRGLSVSTIAMHKAEPPKTHSNTWSAKENNGDAARDWLDLLPSFSSSQDIPACKRISQRIKCRTHDCCVRVVSLLSSTSFTMTRGIESQRCGSYPSTATAARPESDSCL